MGTFFWVGLSWPGPHRLLNTIVARMPPLSLFAVQKGRCLNSTAGQCTWQQQMRRVALPGHRNAGNFLVAMLLP